MHYSTRLNYSHHCCCKKRFLSLQIDKPPFPNPFIAVVFHYWSSMLLSTLHMNFAHPIVASATSLHPGETSWTPSYRFSISRYSPVNVPSGKCLTYPFCSSPKMQLPFLLKAISESALSAAESSENDDEEKERQEEKMKSETYSTNMTEAMGAVLTYRHELGMNFDFISPYMIVGSCLQTPEDVDKLRNLGVKTIFCLQQDSDLEYFGVDIDAIRNYANKTCSDIHHLRAPVRDFDAFDLRLRLPAVVSKLHKAISQNGGVAYIHCTAGLGRAPAAAMAYMFWVENYKLNDAHEFLLSKRFCFPKLEAIKSATADILTGFRKKEVTFTWESKGASAVEIAGLDIGWGQKIPLSLDEETGNWTLQREMLEGSYEYKYIVDGEWLVNVNEMATLRNKDGHVNNYVKVLADEEDIERGNLRTRVTGDDPDLTMDERFTIRKFLEDYPNHE